MNPYVSFGLAMCLVLALALAGTAYMAIYFNRKSKADLTKAMTPLAEFIDGQLDLDEATVSGRYRGHPAQGKIALLPGGMGRVFHSQIIDGAGGEQWSATISRPKEGDGPATTEIKPEGFMLDPQLWAHINAMIGEPSLAGLWFRCEYDPAAGAITLTRPMRTRRDFPQPEAFSRWLEALANLADTNRTVLKASAGPVNERRS